MIDWLCLKTQSQNASNQVNQAALACALVTCLLALNGVSQAAESQAAESQAAESQAAEVSFDRAQLSDQFYSEGGTFGDYDGDGHGDVAVGPWIYYGPSFTDSSRFY